MSIALPQGWVAYEGFTHDAEFHFMTSKWAVPGPPPKFNIFTTIFFFNGFEQHLHNTSVIIQPVLQYGFSGCGGGERWTMTSFVVSDSGRAYCGKVSFF
jgi:hypothetical protein